MVSPRKAAGLLRMHAFEITDIQCVDIQVTHESQENNQQTFYFSDRKVKTLCRSPSSETDSPWQLRQEVV